METLIFVMLLQVCALGGLVLWFSAMRKERARMLSAYHAYMNGTLSYEETMKAMGR